MLLIQTSVEESLFSHCTDIYTLIMHLTVQQTIHYSGLEATPHCKIKLNTS